MYKLYFIIAVILLGISNFLTRIALFKINPQYYQIITAFIGTVSIPIYFMVLNTTGSIKEINTSSALLVVAASIIALSASQIISHVIHSLHHVMHINMLVALYPAVSFILSVIFLNEQFSCYKLLGLVLMVAGAIIMGLT